MKTRCERFDEATPVKPADEFGAVCWEQCRQAAALLTQAKQTLIAEVAAAGQLGERMIQLVVNEAEALAWETEYPHLLFPALALEKVQGASEWQRKQGRIRQVSPLMAFAA